MSNTLRDFYELGSIKGYHIKGVAKPVAEQLLDASRLIRKLTEEAGGLEPVVHSITVDYAFDGIAYLSLVVE